MFVFPATLEFIIMQHWNLNYFDTIEFIYTLNYTHTHFLKSQNY